MKFIVTKDLGRLARWLRIIGYDTVYYKEDDKSKLIIASLRDERIVLTRASSMPRSSGIRIVHVKENDVEKQLAQVVKELRLDISEDRTFTRCVDCNEPLILVEKREVKDKVPQFVFQSQNEFKKCPACSKIFWKGTHWDLAKGFLKRHLRNGGS